jgi:fructan beta-fructosidase
VELKQIKMTTNIKSLKLNSLLFFSSILFCLSCNQERGNDSGFSESLIDQHLDIDVSFTEKYRPQFHYTPKINWMNDPNGLVYYEGKYHLFHQYNPFGNQWGYMSWNHAISDDLVHWKHQPVAIPYGKEEEEAIFSGSAVVDHNNTSGFGDGSRPPLVAIYTSHYTREDGSTWQAQSLAYSIDGGETFIKYRDNPVLEFDDPDFRDPKVMWMDDSKQWVMVLALSQQHKVQFYASENLIDWKFLSDFGPDGATGGIWECPDLFPLFVDGNPEDKRWVLHVDMNPGSVAGGSGSQFFIGDWNGDQFIPDEAVSKGEVIWVDYGTDFYAAITWSNIPEEDGRRIWVGWMNNWMYANQIPTYPWRSAMSIPRSIHLVTIDGEILAVQRPVKELEALRDNHVQLENIEVSSGELLLSNEGISGRAYEIVIEMEPGDSETAGFKLRVGDDEETLVGYDSNSKTVFVDRSRSGEDDFHSDFSQRNDAPARLIDGKIRLQIFVDWSSVEVFVNDGEAVITNRIFPDPDSQDVILYSDSGTANITRMDFWTLNSIWK